jgi:Protein of unknown function (DUF1236)
MKPLFGGAAALLLIAGAAAAQTTIIQRDSPSTTVIQGETPSVITRERVELTPEQRTTIYRTVTRERARAVPETIDARLGARVPGSVELREMPTIVVQEVPDVRRYRYMVVNNEVLLVDPATSEVIEIIRQ